MTAYYVDIAATYNSTNNAYAGTSSGAAWAGAGGIQRAMATLAAGDSVYFKAGTCDLTKCKKITFGTGTTGTLAIGDDVISTTTSGGSTPDAGAGQGYIVYVESATVVWIAVTSGTWASGAGHYLTGDVSNYGTGAISAVATPGPTTVTAGTASAVVRYIGCDSSWVPIGDTLEDGAIPAEGDIPTFDGNATAVSCFTLNGGSSEYARISWLDFADGSYWAVQPGKYRFVMEGCIIRDSPYGIVQPAAYSSTIRCQIYGNAHEGINNPSSATLFAFCSIHDNGGDGITRLAAEDKVISCVIYNNSGHGILNRESPDGYSVTIIKNVIDNNGKDGISIQEFGTAPEREIWHNRITRNGWNGDAGTYYGINCYAASDLMTEDFNVFYSNGQDADGTHTHDRHNIAAGRNSISCDDATECGYTDPDGDPPDYNLTTSAIGRSMEMQLD